MKNSNNLSHKEKDTQHSKIDSSNISLKTLKKNNLKKILLIVGLILLSNVLLVGFGLLWQWKFDILSITNAFYLSAVILFSFGFIVYASNNNVFSPLVYGTKSFFLMFAGKKPKLSYHDYVQDIKENPASGYLIYIPMIASLPSLITAIVLHIVYNSFYYPGI